MCDFFEDDFDDFEDEGEPMDEDSDSLEGEMDDPLDGDSDLNGEPDPQNDDLTARDAFFAGTFAGWAYEEGLRERKRKKRKGSGDDSD